MRIAIVTDMFDDSLNGAVISTRRLVDLLRQEHDVTLVTTGAEAPGRVILPRFYPPFASRVMKRMQFGFAWPRRAVLRRVFADVDVVHCQFAFPVGIASIGIARRLGKPVVSTFHVQAEQLAYNIGIQSERVVSLFYKFFIASFYDRCDEVVCPSRFAEQELRRRGLRAPTRVISNGVTPLYRQAEAPRAPAPDGRFVVLMVGRLAAEKRQEVLIDAVSRSRHKERIELVLLGTGPRREEIERLASRLPRPVRITAVPPEQVVAHYQQADLYVHASEVEVECLTVLEAMACGRTPVIADSERSATRQFALDERSLFSRGNPDELARRIDYWIEHPEELARSNERYLRAAEAYRIENSARALVGLYQDVTRKSLPGPS